jgi:hypothetical protein
MSHDPFIKSSMASRSVHFDVRSRKLSIVGQLLDRWPKFYYLELRASEGTLSRWSRLNLQSLVPTNLHWVRMMGYDPFFLRVIYKEGLCPSSGDINRLMMSHNGNACLSRQQYFHFRFLQDAHILPKWLSFRSVWFQSFSGMATDNPLAFYVHRKKGNVILLIIYPEHY